MQEGKLQDVTLALLTIAKCPVVLGMHTSDVSADAAATKALSTLAVPKRSTGRICSVVTCAYASELGMLKIGGKLTCIGLREPPFGFFVVASQHLNTSSSESKPPGGIVAALCFHT